MTLSGPGRRGIRAATAVLLVAIGLLGAGCAVQKPTMMLRDIEVTGLDFEKVDLALEVVVTNPNDFPINLYAYDYSLSAAGRRIAGGSLPRPVTSLKASGTTVIRAPLSLMFRRLRPLVAQAKAGEGIDYELASKATFHLIGLKIKVPMKRTGTLPALRAPAWRFVDLRLTRDPLGATVVFEVDNPNSFALPLRSLSGMVKYGDKPLVRVDKAAFTPIPARRKALLTVPVKVESGAIAMLLTKGLADRRSLSFEGNLTLDAPVSLHDRLISGLDKND